MRAFGGNRLPGYQAQPGIKPVQGCGEGTIAGRCLGPLNLLKRLIHLVLAGAEIASHPPVFRFEERFRYRRLVLVSDGHGGLRSRD